MTRARQDPYRPRKAKRLRGPGYIGIACSGEPPIAAYGEAAAGTTTLHSAIVAPVARASAVATPGAIEAPGEPSIGTTYVRTRAVACPPG